MVEKGDDSSDTFQDRLVSDWPIQDTYAEKSELSNRVRDFLLTLAKNDREKDLIESRITAFDPEALAKIGKRWGVCKDRVRQIEQAFLVRVKNNIDPSMKDLICEQES